MKRRLLTSESMDRSCTTTCNDVMLVERNAEPLDYALVNPESVGRRAPSDLVELAQEIQKADNFVKTAACSKLQIIAEHVRFLHEQARAVLVEAKQNSRLHHAACNFQKIPGKIYYLYRRPSGQEYFSMISPTEWGSSSPHEFIGGYRLEEDMSWTPLEKIKQQQRDLLSEFHRCFFNNLGSIKN